MGSHFSRVSQEEIGKSVTGRSINANLLSYNAFYFRLLAM